MNKVAQKVVQKRKNEPKKWNIISSKTVSRIVLATLLLLLIEFSGTACQHARIVLPPPAPKACLVPQVNNRAQRLCELMRKRQEDAIAQQDPATRQKTVYEQKFYLWGLYPKEMEYAATDMCSQGVYEIYQYSTWKDSLWQHITIGFMAPRTLEITCY